MKLKKALAMILVVAAAGTALAFAGCDNTGTKPDENNNPSGGTQDNQGSQGGNQGGSSSGGLQTYTFEAEYTDLDGVQGAGISSDQGGVEMIYGDGTDEQKALGWSNGYYVGYTYSANLEITFEFEADKAATGTVVLRLGSELGAITLDPTSFAIKLNDSDIAYQSLYVEGSNDYPSMKFYDLTVTTSAALKAGKNTISLVILPNTLCLGTKTGGPTIDCLKVTTTAALTWTPKTENPSNRGGIL